MYKCTLYKFDNLINNSYICTNIIVMDERIIKLITHQLQNNLTDLELSQKIGISRQTLYHIKKGVPVFKYTETLFIKYLNSIQ